MYLRRILCTVLLLATFQSGSANASCDPNGRCLPLLVPVIIGLTILPFTPIRWWRYDISINRMISKWKIEARMQQAINKITEALEKEDDAVFVLATDIDQTMRYRGQPHEKVLHEKLSQLFDALNLKNKITLIYNTNKSFLNLETFNYKTSHKLSHVESQEFERHIILSSLGTLPLPDILMSKGGSHVCPVLASVQWMVDLCDEYSTCKEDLKHIYEHPLYQYPFWRTELGFIASSIPGGDKFDLTFGGSEAEYRFRSESELEAYNFLTDYSKNSSIIKITDHNLPVVWPATSTFGEKVEKMIRGQFFRYYSKPLLPDNAQETVPPDNNPGFILFTDRYYNKGAALSRVMHLLNDKNHFKGKKVYLITAGDSIFDVSMMTPSLQYPFDEEYPEAFKLKQLPENVNFLGAVLAKTVDPEDQKSIFTLMERFPKFREHVTKSQRPDILGLVEAIADILSNALMNR